MITAWRLAKAKRANTAFDGEGARAHGGRWNQKGKRVVYLADSLALAALEQFVHLGKAHAKLRFVSFRIQIPDELSIDTIVRDDLPPKWRQEPPPAETQDIGTDWLEHSKSCLLRVPSAVIPVENNLVLNPDHTDFAKLLIDKPEPFSFDPRMWK